MLRSCVAVPEYEVVRVRSRLPARGDLAGGGGGGTTTSTTTTTTTTSTSAPPAPPPPEDSGGRPAATAEAADVSRVVELSAFGRQHQLRLRPAHGLLNKELKVFVADQANGTDVDYTELDHVSTHFLAEKYFTLKILWRLFSQNYFIAPKRTGQEGIIYFPRLFVASKCLAQIHSHT